MKIKKAVIPAAGLGTRMLPSTKTVPKEMLHLVDRPVIQYVVEEAVAAGVEEIILITSPGKSAMDNYFLPAPELEDELRARGKAAEAELVRRTGELAKITFVEQAVQKGLGHAVWCARKAVGDEPFAVLLGDDIMWNPGYPVLKQLVDAAEKYSCSAIATREVDDEHVVKYSSLKITPLEERIYNVLDMNEKPTLAEKLSNHAILGRYVLTPDIFPILEHTAPGRNNEIQLTDGLRELCLRDKMVAVDFMGERYDSGNTTGFLEAVIELALDNPDTAGWMREYILRRAEMLK